MNIPRTDQPKLTPIYQCNSEIHHLLHSMKEHLHQLCDQHKNRLVKVETIDGEVFEGHIVHHEKGIVFLSLSNEGHDRAFFPGYPNPYFNNNVILPLVLFNLLTIALL